MQHKDTHIQKKEEENNKNGEESKQETKTLKYTNKQEKVFYCFRHAIVSAAQNQEAELKIRCFSVKVAAHPRTELNADIY